MGKPGKRVSDELKAEAVRLVLEGNMSTKVVAEQCGVGYQSLCNWVKAEKLKQKSFDNDLVEENERLKAEIRELRMEREILKKAAAFFAKESR